MFRPLLGDGVNPVSAVNDGLSAWHYLGPSRRGFAYVWEGQALVFAPPTSRRLPTDKWVELTRWCIPDQMPRNSGSRAWAHISKWLRDERPELTTVVSYSDPSADHDGALYRACNWRWAPTWHRLRPPPSGNGMWSKGKAESVKDRWVFPLRPDSEREEKLAINDDSIRRRIPWAEYREPRWKRGRPTGGGGDYKRWRATQ